MLKRNESNYIISIGASAGGLEAIKFFFFSIKETYKKIDFTYVIVSHLSPNHNTLLVDIVSKFTKLSVEEIKHNSEAKLNYVYIIPPNKQLKFKNNVFKLTSRNKAESAFHPINVFFESLSIELKEKAIFVLLSGTGEDGSLCLQKVRKNGGLIIVADPKFSKFDGMPINAIRTGMVDLVLHPKEMIHSILEYVNENENMYTNGQTSFEAKSLENILFLIKQTNDIDFSKYKKSTILRRLQQRMVKNEFTYLEEYFDFIKKNNDELIKLQYDFLIGVSSFFRDKDAFLTIQNKVIPKIFKRLKKEQTIRIWCCGSSKGQEAYSLAILFKEYMLEHNINHTIKIFATDINRKALEYANVGEYNVQEIKDIPADILEKHFEATTSYTYKIKQNIKDTVLFAYHNILKDPPFTNIDLISCRNLMIYIKPQVQQKIIALFHYSVKSNGYLFLGTCETIGKYEKSGVETIDRKHKIYTIKHSSKYLLNNIQEQSFTKRKENIDYWQTTNMTAQHNHYNERLLNKVLMLRYVPPTIFVNDKMELVHIFGDTKPYLCFPANTVRLNIELIIVDSLKILILTGIKECFQKRKSIFYTNIECYIEDKYKVINIEILYNVDDFSSQNRVQISFKDTQSARTKKEVKTKLDLGKYPNEYISDLEFQLRESKEDLQIVAEEMESTNEELQTSNEELLSTNEELQSTNEELQSVNEELLMINSEHQEKIKDLNELNNDINNLLGNIDVSTIFLDKDLNIRRFTDSLKLGLQLRNRDVGRPIKEINLKLKYPKFVEDLQKVLTTGNKFSKEIQTDKAQWVMMNILPYNNTSGEITGTVITYYNVTTLKNLSQVYEEIAKEFRAKDEKLNLLLAGYPDLIIEFDKNANFVSIIAGKNYKNPISSENNLSKLLTNKNITEFDFIPKNLKTTLQKAITSTLKSNTATNNIVKIKNKQKKDIYLEIRIEPVSKNNVTCVIRDVTELQNAQLKLDKKVVELKTSNEKLQQYINSNLELEKFAYIASHDMKEPLRGIITFSQLIKSKIEEKDYTNINEFLELIITSGNRMFKLIEEVLEYSKVDSKDFNPQKVNLNAILNEITTDFNVSIQSRNIKIEIDKFGEFYGDEMLIRETFLNLVSNAIKFNTNEKPLIHIKEASTKTEYVYEISDNGIGIKESYFDTIFLIFKRLHTKDDYDGTGLGLSICKKAIEKHKGNIKIQSKINKGTTFTITIPKNAY